MNDRWVSASTVVAAGGVRVVLSVRHRPGDERWIDLAALYWRGDLPGLERVRSSRAAVVERGSLEPGGRRCYFKRYLLRGPLDALKHGLRPSRAARALAGGELLARLGFGAPRTLCAVDARRFGLVVESALVTEALEDAPSADEWLSRPELRVAGSNAERRRFVEFFGREVGRCHAAGIYHGDMRLGNVLCRRQGGTGESGAAEYRFFWLDNERTRRFARLPWRRRIQNLTQVNVRREGVTRGDRLRFWRAYVESARLPREFEGRAVREVLARTEARWRRWERRRARSRTAPKS
jgi:hypothetical protein